MSKVVGASSTLTNRRYPHSSSPGWLAHRAGSPSWPGGRSLSVVGCLPAARKRIVGRSKN